MNMDELDRQTTLLHCTMLCLNVAATVFGKTLQFLYDGQDLTKQMALIECNGFSDEEIKNLMQFITRQRELVELDFLLLYKLINRALDWHLHLPGRYRLKGELNKIRDHRNRLVHEHLHLLQLADNQACLTMKHDLISRLQAVIRRTGSVLQLSPIIINAWKHQLNLDIERTCSYRIFQNMQADQEPPPVNDQEFSPQANDQEPPPQANDHEPPPQANDQEPPPQANDQEPPLQANDQEPPPQANDQEPPPQTNEQEPPSQANDQEPPPRANDPIAGNLRAIREAPCSILRWICNICFFISTIQLILRI